MAEEKIGTEGDDLTYKSSDPYIEGEVKEIIDRSYTKKDGTVNVIKRITIHYYNEHNVLTATCFDVYGNENFNKMELCTGGYYGFTLRLLLEVNYQTKAPYPKILCYKAKRMSTVMK